MRKYEWINFFSHLSLHNFREFMCVYISEVIFSHFILKGFTVTQAFSLAFIRLHIMQTDFSCVRQRKKTKEGERQIVM